MTSMAKMVRLPPEAQNHQPTIQKNCLISKENLHRLLVQYFLMHLWQVINLVLWSKALAAQVVTSIFQSNLTAFVSIHL